MIIHMLAQAVTATAPPPAPPAPPVIQVAPSTGEVSTVDVDVRADRETLFSAPLRVAMSSPATVQHEQSEAPTLTCPRPSYGGRATSRLHVQVAAAYAPRDGERFTVSVSWSRPVERDCSAPMGSRTVELSDTVTLARGRPVTVAGDGGLSVTLRRR